MTFATVIQEMVEHLPDVRTRDPQDFDENAELAYVIFGDHLRPMLESALASGNLVLIVKICAFLEEVAISGESDGMLANLLAVEIGEWLEFTPYEAEIAPWLGIETKRICGYVPGLATQRIDLRKEAAKRTLGAKFSRLKRRLFGRSSDAD